MKIKISDIAKKQEYLMELSQMPLNNRKGLVMKKENIFYK